MGKTRAIPSEYHGGYLGLLDQRTEVAGRMRARWIALTSDLGGADRLSYAQRSLCERALWLEHWLHLQEQALAEGRHADFSAGAWTQACNSLLGILTRLGLERQARDVTSLTSYLAAKAPAGD